MKAGFSQKHSLFFFFSKCLMLGLIMLCSYRVNCQYAEKGFIQYTIKEGLSDNNISCITQDSRGFIWIGTESGLNRYDGDHFENYYQGIPAGFLTSSNIYKFSHLPNNRLAIITMNGLQVINTENFTIRQYIIPDSTSFMVQLNSFRDAMEFQDGTIGATTATGFYVFDTNAALIYRHDAFDREDQGNKRLMYGRQIFSVSDDNALVYVREDSLAEYNIPSRAFRELPRSEQQWKMFLPPVFFGWRGITQINDNEYMFLTRSDSLFYYDHRQSRRIGSKLPPHIVLTWESKVFMHNDSTFLVNSGYEGFYSFRFNRTTGEIIYSEELHFKDYKVRCFFQDQTGHLWIGTTDGLFKQRSKPAFTQTYHWPIEDISRIGYSDAIRCRDKLYLSRYSRDIGLVQVDLDSKQVEREFSFYGKNNPWNEVFVIQKYHPDTLWLGTNAGLLWFDMPTGHFGKIGEQIPGANAGMWSRVTPQKNGYTWLCDYLEGSVARYHHASRHFEIFHRQSQPALPFVKVKNLAHDAYGDTWIGGHSLSRWNHKTATFDTLMTSYAGPNKYDDDIKLLRADEEGSLWLHNAGNGLLRYHITDKEWTHYGMQDGLPSEVIQSMSPVMDHTLWLTCQNQVIRFDTESGKMEIYDQNDGIPDIKPVAWNMYVDADRRELYAFYQDKVTILPFDYRRDTTATGELLFQEVIVNNQESFFFPKQALRLGTKENNLTIHFTVIDYNDGQQNKFAYRMNARDEWTNLGNQRILNLLNLAPGDYSLEMAATGKSGVRKTKTLLFSIAKPFWATPWFILICVVVLTTIIYLIYRMRIAQYHQKANLDKLLSQTEMKALHAQMNPHFIFNSLNSIREMILHNETQEASRFLGNFAHLIRLTLDQSRQPFISLRSTMDYINRYIEMEKIRNPDFHFRMEADETLEPDETVLPPMLIQPFIENAIWHGMNGEEKEIHIVVQFKKQGEQLVCIIEDDGIGIEQAIKNKNGKKPGHESVSIANIRKRIELLNQKHDLHSSIAITDKNLGADAGTGTLVSITLPLEINES